MNEIALTKTRENDAKRFKACGREGLPVQCLWRKSLAPSYINNLDAKRFIILVKQQNLVNPES